MLLLDLNIFFDSYREMFGEENKPGMFKRVPSVNCIAFVALGKSSKSVGLNSPLIHVHRMTFPSLAAEQNRKCSLLDGAHHRTFRQENNI